jgi:hypothetical protein
MTTRKVIYVLAILLMFVFVSCVLSQVSWSMKENNSASLREVVGLPSIAVGNLNPSARNPGVEILCTGLLDVPGGYCNYFATGVPFIDFPMATNFTIVRNITESGK